MYIFTKCLQFKQIHLNTNRQKSAKKSQCRLNVNREPKDLTRGTYFILLGCDDDTELGHEQAIVRILNIV